MDFAKKVFNKSVIAVVITLCIVHTAYFGLIRHYRSVANCYDYRVSGWVVRTLNWAYEICIVLGIYLLCAAVYYLVTKRYVNVIILALVVVTMVFSFKYSLTKYTMRNGSMRDAEVIDKTATSITIQKDYEVLELQTTQSEVYFIEVGREYAYIGYKSCAGVYWLTYILE